MTEQNTASERRLQRRALQALKEWLSSERFREKASFETVWASTSLAKEIERRRKEDSQWWADEDGKRLRQLCKDVQKVWVDCGWVQIETRTVGRPRGAEYTRDVLNKAWRLYNYGGPKGFRADSSYEWAESVLGEKSARRTTKVVIVHEAVHRELLEAIGPDEIDGLTRPELAMRLELSKPYTNRFVRWLLDSGEWKEVRTRDGFNRDRVLRRSEE